VEAIIGVVIGFLLGVARETSAASRATATRRALPLMKDSRRLVIEAHDRISRSVLRQAAPAHAYQRGPTMLI
jgi:hypothetical protein